DIFHPPDRHQTRKKQQMLIRMLSYFTLPLALLLSNSSGISAAPSKSTESQTGTLEKMIVATGNVSMDLDLNRLNGTNASQESKPEALRFQVSSNSFFTVLVFNNSLRGSEMGSMGLVPTNSVGLPTALQASVNNLVIDKLSADAAYDMAVRDSKTG